MEWQVMGWTRESRRRLGVGVVVGVVAAVGLPLVAQGAPPAKTSFTLRGSLTGTLHVANRSCADVSGFGGQFEFKGQKVKGLKATTWVVNVNAQTGRKKGGTFTKFGGLTGNGVSIVLVGSKGTTSNYWTAKSGTLTTAIRSGHLNVQLGPDRKAPRPGKGNVDIVGSWGCARH